MVRIKQVVSLILVSMFLSHCVNDHKTEVNSMADHSSPDDNRKESESAIAQAEQKFVPSISETKEQLSNKGYQFFDYVDEETKDTIIMQQYYIAFLKKGPNRSQNEKEAAKLQEQHLTHLGKMYELGFADISGPFGDDGEIRGITIYNVPTQRMADSLANADPMVKAGRLTIETHPWWAAKGFPLR